VGPPFNTLKFKPFFSKSVCTPPFLQFTCPQSDHKEVNKYAQAMGKPPLELEPDIYKRLHLFNAGYKKLSRALFTELQPAPGEFIEKIKEAFDTPFFDALGKYLKATGQSPGYGQTVMEMPLLDARGIHEALA